MKRMTALNGKVVLQPLNEATFDLDELEGDLVEIIEQHNSPCRSIIEMLDEMD